MKRFVAMITMVFFLSAFPMSAKADMAGDLNGMLNNFQAMGNLTVPGAYTGQTQSYATAGALSVRIPRTTINPGITFTPPSFKAGCGGIDINLGGVSYLTNPQQLIQKVQTILANSAGVLFFLALQTLSPEIATINDMMNKAGDFMNSLNLDSCHAAQKLVGLGIDTLMTDSTQKCALQRLTNGSSSTMEDARLACAGSTGSPTNNGGNPTPGSELDPNSNFTYMAIQKYSYGSDPVLTNEIQSLIGSVIYTTNTTTAATNVTTNPALINVDAFIGGATNVTLYTCPNPTGDPLCLTMTTTTGNINGFYPVVNNILTSIYNKLSNSYAASSPLSLTETAFIDNSPVPILKTLNILSANPSWGPGELPALAQIMTTYFAKIYIERLLDDIQEGLNQYDTTHGGEQLKQMKQYYAERRKEIERQLAQFPDQSPEKIYYTTQYLEIYNTAMMQRLGKDIVSNLNFARKVGG